MPVRSARAAKRPMRFRRASLSIDRNSRSRGSRNAGSPVRALRHGRCRCWASSPSSWRRGRVTIPTPSGVAPAPLDGRRAPRGRRHRWIRKMRDRSASPPPTASGRPAR
jgi:hypothetical protein